MKHYISGPENQPGHCWTNLGYSRIGCYTWSTIVLLPDFFHTLTRSHINMSHNGWTSIHPNTSFIPCDMDAQLYTAHPGNHGDGWVTLGWSCMGCRTGSCIAIISDLAYTPSMHHATICHNGYMDPSNRWKGYTFPAQLENQGRGWASLWWTSMCC